ncbi:hypothetical protein [Chitinophaga pinensis]|uniref:YD repeat-containing protein n=1 Tax=Chitinophaga pinensis TaxID=79329 RepID=A0A5C6LNV3_9BACT|nr:hypothetical protein [Chitinophaga pinensis]TWV99164.1 hypothetical protein FEF09_17990 [Chitinophaga pinensis]
MKRILLSAAVLGLFFTACKDDETNTPQPDVPVKLLAKETSKYDSTVLTYDAGKKLSLYKYYGFDSDDDIMVAKPSYENNQLIAFLTGPNEQTATHKAVAFGYNTAGKVFTVNFYDVEDGSLNQYDSIAYNADGRVSAVYIAEKVAVVNHLGFFEKNVFEWDAKGNVVKTHRIAFADGKEATDTTTTILTYDDKVNYTAKQLELYLIDVEEVAASLSANNILTATTQFELSKQTITNVYTYDAENYPITKISTRKEVQGGIEIGSSVDNRTMIYIKK